MGIVIIKAFQTCNLKGLIYVIIYLFFGNAFYFKAKPDILSYRSPREK